MATLPEIVGAVVEDALTLAGIPGAVGRKLLTDYLRRHVEAAREILLEEMRLGNVTAAQAASQDDVIGVTYRYLRVAQEGAARLNLRLLAKVIVGQFEAGRLVADEFLAVAEALASLSRDEVFVIGMLYRAWSEQTAQLRNNPATLPQGINPWGATMRELQERGWSDARITAAATRSQRSGLIVGASAYGGMAFNVGPSLIELGKTVDFQDALRREGLA
jgi:hypothetical protein